MIQNKAPEIPQLEDEWSSIGSAGDFGGLDLRPKQPDVSDYTTLERLMQVRPDINPVTAVTKILEDIQFERRGKPIISGKDIIGLMHYLPDGKIVNYAEDQVKSKLKGKPESASYGISKIGGNEAVVYAMHYEYMGGSLGVAAGEEFQRAADAATKSNLPLVCLFASGGARQQEQSAALVQMERIVQSLSDFKKNTDQPCIAVIAGQVWGGISACAVPNADLIVGLAGSNFGFSGPKVIESYENKKVPIGAQSVEANLLNRTVDIVVQDEDELVDFLGSFLSTIKKDPKQELSEATMPEVHFVGEQHDSRTMRLGSIGISRALYKDGPNQELFIIPGPTLPSPDMPDDELLMERYNGFKRSPSRPDTEFVIQAFKDPVPLYNHIVDPFHKARADQPVHQHIKAYPGIISAVAKIGPQPVLLIGHQPSYQKLGDRMSRIPSSPKPQDFEHAQRMMRMGARLKLPVAFLCDTLGADPSLKSEQRGISTSIAETMTAAYEYPHPVLTTVIGPLGSGGGLALAPRGDHRAFTEGAMMYVSEPNSLVSIIGKLANPDPLWVRFTHATMRATAKDQKELGFSQQTIPESSDPLRTAINIRDSIGSALIKATQMSDSKRLKARRRNTSNMRGFTLEDA